MSNKENSRPGQGDDSLKQENISPEAGKKEHDRGRQADGPLEFPRRGWRDILLRVWNAIGVDHLSIVAAGVAFFLLMGIIPALAALVMVYGFFANPEDVHTHFKGIAQVLPPEVYQIFMEQMQAVSSPKSGAGIGAIVTIALAIWAGARGTKGLIQALNIAYNEDETRRFLKLQFIAFVLTLSLILLGVMAILLVAGLPAVISLLQLDPFGERLILWLRWIILILIWNVALSGIYRFGPSRRKAQWKWVSTGAMIATVVWILASAGFSYYVSRFGDYNETYGSLAAVVILLLWLYITAFLILLGAEINASMEHQTARDTTRGKPKPMGKRGAYVADHLGRSP